MKILVTGSAGFIGNVIAKELLERGDEVLGIDNLNPYYDVALKEARHERLAKYPGFSTFHENLEDKNAIARIFSDHRPDRVIHLAAQAGVRYSLENPHVYVDSNITGFLNILEGCRYTGVSHLVYASSSSVYGANTQMPFSVHHAVDHPISLYAATKRANELMAHTYSHLFGLPVTGLRFFTVYGPWGRPDMALFLFVKAIDEGRPIDVFNEGRMKRSFTYIDDIVGAAVRTLDLTPKAAPAADRPDPAVSRTAPFRIFNIGHGEPVELMRYIEILEDALGKKAVLNMLPLQPGDVPASHAETKDLEEAVGFEPLTPVEVGIRRFVEWYRDFYKT